MSDRKKPKLSLIPFEALELVARAFEEGNNREGRDPDDWKEKEPQLFLDALLRHAGQASDGSGDTRLVAVAAVACNALMLLWHYSREHSCTEYVQRPIQFDGNVYCPYCQGKIEPGKPCNTCAKKLKQQTCKHASSTIDESGKVTCNDCGNVTMPATDPECPHNTKVIIMQRLACVDCGRWVL